MNLPSPDQALSEFRRLLSDGGKLVLHEVLQGQGGSPHFPVPWASESTESFLIDEDRLKQQLDDAGFEICQWHDQTAEALAWRKRQQLRAQQSPPPRSPLKPEMVFGERFAEMTRNLLLNLEQFKVKVVSIILQ